jgi:hypothetical protein
MDPDPDVARSAANYMETYAGQNGAADWRPGSLRPVPNPNYRPMTMPAAFAQAPSQQQMQQTADSLETRQVLITIGVALAVGYVMLLVAVRYRRPRRG